MTRFTTVAMEIPNLNPEVQLHAIKSGLRPRKFQEAIAVTKSKILEEFWDKATGQIKIEELHETRRNVRPPFRKEEDKPYRSQNKDSKKPFKLATKFNSYTRFNTKREDIIKEILHNKLIRPPSRAGSYQDQRHVDKSKHYAFHKKFGHTTDESVIAKDLLKRLARQGHLDKFISGRIQQNQRNTTDAQSEQDPSTTRKTRFQPSPTKGVINCIAGGFAGGGPTTSARKHNYRAMMMVQKMEEATFRSPHIPTISFEQSDYRAKATNLDDPVAISIQVGDLLVRKVLLDLGSSADVLCYSTFKKMKLGENLMQPSLGELVGFSGERVSILGSIWLKITTGDNPLFKT
ncbi:uncharacterized protein [Arachis hypogaea]|uniref:uncharacterized protein n=1 Tax=Arachis hypogaea TaxID=3818 RepID=UPI000DEC8D5E|nr:uncharacterized protein LOC112803516 [Arachis hypogaea]